ncbi:MAG TPA: hypothetical protein VNE63_10020 [Candidatus Acidoferrales bacterium]|nr:hypothetical protein [Candidatus Acidoferrales bacterium]
MAQDNSSVKQSPYMSYGVFSKSIEMLSETTVPSGPLDRRVLSGISGADYGALIPGLRFLGLIDDERKATTQYRELVEAWKNAPKFKEVLLEILVDKYAPIIGKLNLKTGTSAELEKAFKDYGVSTGQMLTKTIRFFVKAITEAGVTLSPHITARKPRIANTTPKKNGSDKGVHAKGRKDGDESEEEIPNGIERLPLPGMPNSFIQYPANLTEAHCQILEAMIGVLRKSVEARVGIKERKP